MSDRRTDHYTAVDWAERAVGVAVLGIGALIYFLRDDLLVAAVVGGLGLWIAAPGSRGVLSWLVDLIPLLPSKPPPPPRLEE